MHDENETGDFEPMWQRLIWMIIISFLLSVAQSFLWILTFAQFVIMLLNKREPNLQLQEFGTTLGVWMAKAVRYLTAGSEVKPWPWTEFD